MKKIIHYCCQDFSQYFPRNGTQSVEKTSSYIWFGHEQLLKLPIWFSPRPGNSSIEKPMSLRYSIITFHNLTWYWMMVRSKKNDTYLMDTSVQIHLNYRNHTTFKNAIFLKLLLVKTERVRIEIQTIGLNHLNDCDMSSHPSSQQYS